MSDLNSTIYRIYLAAAIFIVGSTTAFDSANGQDWARKMFSELSHDFGTVSKNENAEYRFEITNLYNEDIRIQSVQTSCTCTDVRLTKKVLKSAESCELIAVFNTRNFVGPKQATVTVRFAAPYNAEVQLTVRGVIRGDVMFEPGSIDFGSLTSDMIMNNAGKRQIQITKFNSPNWRITDVKSNFRHIGVVLSNPMPVGNQVRYNMEVRIKDSAPAGFVQDKLMIVAQDNGQTSNIPINFSGKVASALQISPEVLTFATSANAGEIKKKVIVKGDRPFKINEVNCSNNSFVFNVDRDKSSKVHFVGVSYAADKPPGRYEFDLDFLTDLNAGAKRSIKAIVQIKPAASVRQ